MYCKLFKNFSNSVDYARDLIFITILVIKQIIYYFKVIRNKSPMDSDKILWSFDTISTFIQ